MTRLGPRTAGATPHAGYHQSLQYPKSTVRKARKKQKEHAPTKKIGVPPQLKSKRIRA